MIEQAEKKHIVELSRIGQHKFVHVLREQFDVGVVYFGHKFGLFNLSRHVNAEHVFRSALLHLDREKSGVAGKIEHGLTSEVLRYERF